MKVTRLEPKQIPHEGRAKYPCYQDKTYDVFGENDYFVVVRKLNKHEFKFSTSNKAVKAIDDSYLIGEEPFGDLDKKD